MGEYRYQIMTLQQPQAPGVRPSVAGVTSTYLSKAREIDLRAGDQSSLDFNLALAPAFSVSGVVEGSKGGALVAVRLTSLTEPAMMQFSTGPPLSSETGYAMASRRGSCWMSPTSLASYPHVFVIAAAGSWTVSVGPSRPSWSPGPSESVQA